MTRGRQVAEKAAFDRGFFVGRATTPPDVRRTMELLVPVRTTARLIRIGAMGDGGYLVPDDLVDIGLLFSPGVAANWSFEEDLLERAGIEPVLCDRLDDATDCPFPIDNFWLGPSSGDGVRSLEDWIASRGSVGDSDLFLQMDIEGSEFTTILACPESALARFRVIVIEFHELHRIHDAFVNDYLIRPTLEKLDRLFNVVHVHPNNGSPIDRRSGMDVPRVLEVTYLRKDRAEVTDGSVELPHPLDLPNVPDLPDVALSDAWRAGRIGQVHP